MFMRESSPGISLVYIINGHTNVLMESKMYGRTNILKESKHNVELTY